MATFGKPLPLAHGRALLPLQALLEAALQQQGQQGPVSGGPQPSTAPPWLQQLLVLHQRPPQPHGKQSAGGSSSPRRERRDAAAGRPAAPPAARYTAKELQKLHRKEQLKAAIRHMLGPGLDGRAKLPGTVTEVEKLVEAIHGLAGTGAGRARADGMGASGSGGDDGIEGGQPAAAEGPAGVQVGRRGRARVGGRGPCRVQGGEVGYGVSGRRSAMVLVWLAGANTYSNGRLAEQATHLASCPYVPVIHWQTTCPCCMAG